MKIQNVLKVILMACFGLAATANAATHADLVADYDESGGLGSNAVFSGSSSGTWTALADDDLDPLTPGSILTMQATGDGGGDGFAGPYTSAGFYLPAISEQGLFDGASPPAGTLAIHPGNTGTHLPRQSHPYLVIQYTATADLTNVFVNYSLDRPDLANPDSINFAILDNAGSALVPTTHVPAGGIVAGSQAAGSLLTGESVYLLIDDNGWFGGDQTWLSYEIKSDFTAALVSPENNDNLVLPVTQLKWTSAEGADNQYVYFAAGADPLALIATLSGDANSVDPVPLPLELDTDYSWRVDTEVGGETFTGDLWSFHTRVALYRDINHDGIVNLEDYAALALRYMQTNCYEDAFCGGADFNLSNTVNIMDMFLLETNWLDQAITLGTLLNEMADRERLAAYPTIPYTQHQASSYDRRSVTPGNPDWFANYDWENYIRQEVNEGRDEWVMMEDFGPGCITRIWIGGQIHLHGDLRFYVDGATSPVWQGKTYQIIGENPSVGSPLSSLSGGQVFLANGAKSAANLYMPIPYNTSIKVTYDVAPLAKPDTSKALWYNINYRKYPAGENVRSFSSNSTAEYAAMLAQVNTQLPSPSAAPLPQKQQFNLSDDIASGAFIEQVISGAGAICRLTLDLSAGDMGAALQETKLEIRFDDQLTVSSIPVGMFYGTGKQINEVKDWYRTVDSQTNQMNAYWVMPYQQSAKVRVVNTGTQSVTVALEIESGEFAWEPNTMYFHADNHQEVLQTAAQVGQDWNYVHILGQGVYVGDTLMVSKNVSGWWGEGDEKIWVDGESFPSHFGTGTEDYYGYAWGHIELFLQPFIGQPQSDANRDPGTTVNSRVRALDAIPFNSSIKLDMESWNWHGGPVDFNVVTFWYGMPGATLAP